MIPVRFPCLNLNNNNYNNRIEEVDTADQVCCYYHFLA